MLFDAHSHLQFPEFDKDRDEVISRIKKEGMICINVGTNQESSQGAAELTEKYEGFFAGVGLHPIDINREKFNEGFYEKLINLPKVLAIGECGLDEKATSSKEKQKEIFSEQIKLAIQSDKPLIIHCREAHNEVINILESYFLKSESQNNGVIHFFSGTIENAEKYLNLDFYLSFSGIITYSNQYDELIKFLPLNRILAETDSPFAAPLPYRGQRNEPIYVKEIVKKLAEIKNISFEQMSEITFENARKLFKIKA